MKTATHQRLPALLLLGVGVLLAAGSFWLVEISNRSSGGTAVQRERTEPDYFVDHFTYAKLDAKGRVAYVIEGEKMTHYPVDKHSLIEKPVLRNWSPDRPPTTLRAEQATVNGDRTVVKLMDKVILERAQARGGDALTITSDYMLVLPEKDIVTTDRRVEIRVGDARLSGVGMLANNATRELTLESSVSGFYPAPGKRRAP
jgi:lipopolysaccharide export system protein LptC